MSGASENLSPADYRAAMAQTVLKQMASSGDVGTRENALEAMRLRGIDPSTGASTAAPPPAPAPAPAPAAPAPATTPAPSPSPAPQPPAPTASPLADAALEGLRDTNGLLLGKYRTADELRRGYFNAVNALSKTTDELVTLRNQPVTAAPQPALLPGSAPGAPPRVNPTTRGFDTTKVVEELVRSSEESGTIDPALLVRTIDEITLARAQEVLDARLRPMEAMAEAETYMRTTYPESANHAVEVANFVKTNPQVGATFRAMMESGQTTAAFEYAWQMYAVDAGLGTERKMVANSQIAEEERQQARAAAGFGSSPNTGVHSAPGPSDRPLTAEEVRVLNDIAAQDPVEGEKFRRRVMLGRLMPTEWRTWEQGRQT